jgi:hypothetical protein
MIAFDENDTRAITVFFDNGIPCGTCPQGQENEWLNGINGENRIRHSSQRASTEGKWHEYARRCCHMNQRAAAAVL